MISFHLEAPFNTVISIHIRLFSDYHLSSFGEATIPIYYNIDEAYQH